MRYKYNEKLYGETIYKNGFQTDYIKSELTILVKYLDQVKNMSKKDIEKYLYKFCEEYIEGFNKVKYFKVIDSAIMKGRKKDNKLIQINSIPIYKKELEIIDSLDINHEYKKMLLVFLVNKKINLEIRKINGDETNEMSAYFEANKKKYNEIFKTANINGKIKIDDLIHDLVKAKIIESVINGGIVLKYIYPMYKTREEEYIKKGNIEKRIIIIYKTDNYELYENLTDFDNIGYLFDYYKSVNGVKKCEVCGGYIKTKNNKMKYCKTCAKEIKSEQDKIADKKYKEKQKRENRNTSENQ